ncbi:MAG: polymer-forming cytoskeletal protein [Pseudomonadota bacterium]
MDLLKSRRCIDVLTYTVSIIGLVVATVLIHAASVEAKAPGKRHCYRSVCVDVLTIKEVHGLLGKTVRMTASHYGDPSVDPFNRGTFTSNGERFNANDPTRTASATLPDGTELLLRNPDTGAVSHVRVNDFGPFWVNRELDVTEQVARDLDFEKQGIKALEVTIVSVPTQDDVDRLYRHDRPPLPAMGYLGKRTRPETAKLAQVLLQRSKVAKEELAAQGSVIAGAEPPATVGRVVVREHVYHFVPTQAMSPRALGAEDLSPKHMAAGAAALAQWRMRQQARSEMNAFVFWLLGMFALLAFVAPYGLPLLQLGARHAHRVLTHDDAVEHLRLMLTQEHPTAPARLAHGRLLQLPAPKKEPSDTALEAEVVIMRTDHEEQSNAYEMAQRGSQHDLDGLTAANGLSAHHEPPQVRFGQFAFGLQSKKFISDRCPTELDNGQFAPKKLARIIGEGVCHEGDLRSADAIIISGQVNGHVSSSQVTVEKSGLVDGDVTADWVKVEGWIDGNVVAEKVDLEPSALVSGDVHAKTIRSAPGAVIEGRNFDGRADMRDSLPGRLARA